MFNAIRRHVKYSTYANFWDFLRDGQNFSTDSLEKLAEEGTDTSLIRPWNFSGERFFTTSKPSGQVLEETVHELYNHFSSDIWSACLGAGGYDADRGPWGLSCLARLPLSDQVYNQKTLEEFLVRNGLKRAAKDVLKERGQKEKKNL